MKEKKSAIQDEQVELMLTAIADLESFFEKIKKSRKLLQYKDDGEVIFSMFFNIISAFTLNQLKEFAIKAKMVTADGTKTLNKIERFDFINNQYLGVLHENISRMRKHISEL